MSSHIYHRTRSQTEHSTVIQPAKKIARRTRYRKLLNTAVTAVSESIRRYTYDFILNWAMNVLDEEFQPILKEVWKQSYTNEIGRLVQGVG